jgi:hypothetical protein
MTPTTTPVLIGPGSPVTGPSPLTTHDPADNEPRRWGAFDEAARPGSTAAAFGVRKHRGKAVQTV